MEELHPRDPRQIGSYRLLGRLGRGGMGQVFLGQSPGGRLVAVKLIRPELADGPDFRARFTREVAAARRVSGMFTAPVVDADPDAPTPWLVAAFVDGPSLAALVEHGGPMPEGDVIKLGLALAEGLSAIHAVGVVHRDLKPANVLLATDGPRIIDFGISRSADTTSLTQTGMVVGSPGFMSPEQAEGREVGPPSDVFSLGAVLAFAATGTEPFGSGGASALLYRVVHAEPALTGVSAELRPVLEGCLRKNPAERPAPGALLAALGSLTSEQPRLTADIRPRIASGQSAGASDSAPQLTISRIRPPGGPAPASGATAQLDRVPDAILVAPRRGRRWIAACAAIALVAAGGVALASHGFGMLKQQAEPPGSTRTTTAPPASPRTGTGQPSPRSVVEAYYAAINAHDWRKVWQLGGKNLSPSYAAMVAGFRETSHDKITRIIATGDSVSVRLRAYENTGLVQVYVDTYKVSGDVIASGHPKLISTQRVSPAVTTPA